MKKTVKKLIVSQLLGVAKTIAISLVIYLVVTLAINLLFYNKSQDVTQSLTPVYLIMVVIFGLAYYLGYLKRSSESGEISSGGRYHPVKDMAAFVRGEGKYLFLIYGGVAVLLEIAYLLNIEFLQTALLVCFSVSKLVDIPVVRTLVGYAVTMLVILLTTMIKHSVNNRFWSKNNKEKEYPDTFE